MFLPPPPARKQKNTQVETCEACMGYGPGGK